MQLRRASAPSPLVGRCASPVVQAVIAGLLSAPRRLPSWIFYDERGARLFEQMSAAPTNVAARVEQRVVADRAVDIASFIGATGRATVIELGAGTSKTSDPLLRALVTKGVVCDYCPADGSPAALNAVVKRLSLAYPRVRMRPLVCTHDDAFDAIAAMPGPKTVLFFGGGLGDFSIEEASGFLATLRRSLLPNDYLVLGVDHTRDPRALVAAYDDGITAAFNKNALRRLNKEAGAHFDEAAFDHVVRWDAQRSRVELALQSRTDQHVAVDRLGVTLRFRKGECISTWCSHKWDEETVANLLEQAGFSRDVAFVDDTGLFSVQLARA